MRQTLRLAGILSGVLTTLVVGCSNESGLNEHALLLTGGRHAVIEKNIHRRISSTGEEYENAVLPFEQITDADIEYLADHHPDIRQLRLGPIPANLYEKWKSVENLTDESLRHLGRIESLEQIQSLAGSGITDEGLAHLSGSQKLERLDLSRTKVTGTGLSHLRDLPELDHLTLPAGMTSEGIKVLGTLDNIRFLNVSVSDQSFAPLAAMSQLDRLEIRGIHEDATLEWLQELDSLDDLMILAGGEHVKTAFPQISKMRNLKSISVTGIPVTDDMVAELTACSHLNKIYFSDSTQLTAAAVTSFRHLPNLKWLRVSRCSQEFVDGMVPLTQHPRLAILGLSRGNVDDRALPVLSQFTRIRYLYLSGTQMSEQACKKLHRMLRGRCEIKPSRGPTLKVLPPQGTTTRQGITILEMSP